MWTRAAIVVLGAAAAATALLARTPEPLPADQPAAAPRGDYAGASACKGCHEREHRSWRASFHARMSQRPGPDAILQPWTGEVGVRELKTRLFKKGDEYWVDTPDLDVYWNDRRAYRDRLAELPRKERRIAMVTGSHTKQVYWYGTGQGRELEVLPWVWLPLEQRWTSRDAAFLQPRYWPPRTEIGRWNAACISCHTTGGRPKLSEDHRHRTDVVDLGIACESCHRGAHEHVQAMANPLRRYAVHLGLRDVQHVVSAPGLDKARAVMVCAQCHAAANFKSLDHQNHFDAHGMAYQPGDDLMATLELAEAPTPALLPGKSQFWRDGHIVIGGREFSAMRASPCYKSGEGDRAATCTSCHALHRSPDDPRPLREWADDQLKPGARGDGACTGCHPDGRLQTRAHHHHDPASTGARCMNCHMPHVAYTLLKATRSHTVSSPSVAVAVRTGRPDACSLCHLDKPLAWTSDKLHKWYGYPQPRLDDMHTRLAAGAWFGLAGDAVVRALIAWHMAWPPARQTADAGWFPAILLQRLIDPYPAVRHIALRTLKRDPAFADLEFDVLGTVSYQAATVAALMRRWSSSTRPNVDSPAAAGEALIGGLIRKADFQRAVRARDDAEFSLPE